MFKKEFRLLVSFAFLFLIHIDVLGEKIIGGYLQATNINNLVGYFKITLKLHINETEGGFSENVVAVKLKQTIHGETKFSCNLSKVSSQSVRYSQETCADSEELNTSFVTFEADVYLPPQYSTDPEGYYLEWTECCRSANVVNLDNPESYTTTFRLKCPPVIQASGEFFNSTPKISDLSKFYICEGQPYVYQLNASDLDGDSLNFSTAIPLGQHQSANIPLEWASCCGPLNVNTGRLRLQVDAKTGLFTIFPETSGYHAFGILVEEYRVGRLISATIREYGLYVVKCSSLVVDKNIYLEDAPITSTTICRGNSVTLTAMINPDWHYQWMRNGMKLTGANTSKLEVSQEGEYSFKIVRSGDCEKTVESQKVHVTETQSTFKLEKHGSSPSCDLLSETVLVGPKDLHYTYKWYKNSSLLTDKTNSLTVKEPGNYWAIVESSTCKLLSDTIEIKQNSNSNVNVIIDPILPTCVNADKPIALVGSPSGGVFQGAGIVDGVFYPKQAGVGVHELTYTISSTAPCPDLVAKQTVQVHQLPKIDLLNEICVTNMIGVKIGVQESAGFHYEWLPEEGLDNPTVSMPLVTTETDRSYTLTVSNAEGCKTSKDIQVKICSKLFIPDAFTPNQDGINDTWDLVGLEKYPNVEVTIYNRWGNVIFHSKGYAQPFDGNSFQAGVYHYKVKLDDELPAKSGPLMIIR